MTDEVPLGALIGLLVLLLLMSAFFSGSETALMSLNRYRLRHKSRSGHRGARLAEALLKRPDRLIGLILLGNNLVNFSAASLVAIIALKLGGEPAVAIEAKARERPHVALPLASQVRRIGVLESTASVVEPQPAVDRDPIARLLRLLRALADLADHFHLHVQY